MASSTGIEWTDSTFNPWIGCMNVSPGCDHCYAEAQNAFRGWTTWGPHGVRRRTSAANWANPVKWQAARTAFLSERGRLRRVFCASLADIFDNQAPPGARDDLWCLIRGCPDLEWQILTKRPQNIRRMLPADWGDGYPNVWLGVTAEDQRRFEQRWPVLRDIPARIRFVSYEPALGGVRLDDGPIQPDWLIFGGESGGGARPCDAAWARNVRRDCEARRVAFFLKQWGRYISNPLCSEAGLDRAAAEAMDPKSNGKGGGMLDGALYRSFPEIRSAPIPVAA